MFENPFLRHRQFINCLSSRKDPTVYRWRAPHTRLMSVQPISEEAVRRDRALGGLLWHLRETVSRVKKSHCHAYEPGLACFKILRYHFGLSQDPCSAFTYMLGLSSLS